jgi:SAM-dependent methyltransferase
MVKLYSENAAQLDLEPQKMRAIQGDLMEPGSTAIDTDDFRDFDLAVMCMALHHVPDPLAMIRGLVRMLRPGGKVVIIDWTLDPDQDDGTDVVSPQYSSQYPVAYHGFNQPQMTRLFNEAGCPVTDYQIHPETSHVPAMSNPWRHLFFAKGEMA